MEAIEAILGRISGYVWGIPLLVLLFGTHLFLTVRLGFIQRHLFKAIALSFKSGGEADGDISPFGALTTALAATIGTGNVVGVATAVTAGGPGAVLWMWLTGVFGFATKYAEALLAVKYREVDEDGHVSGGPMYVLERGLGQKWLGLLFALFTAVAAFGIGNTVQANAISGLVEETFHLPRAATGLILAALTGLVILGGIKSIAGVCKRLVPFMASAYILGCIAMLVVNISTLPETIALIFKSAFTGHAAAGGFLGATVSQTVRFGIARGLFSNESGLGSAPIVAAAAKTVNPVRQALISATGTFWDTVVVCALTGMVLVNSGEWTSGTEDAGILIKNAFARLPVVGPFVLTLGMVTFVFSTILGWSYYGEKAVEYILGGRAVLPYRLVWVMAVLVGSVVSIEIVWSFSDIANGLMAAPNLIALLALSGVLAAETRKHLSKDAGALDAPSKLEE